MKSGSGIEAGDQLRRLDAIEAAVADEPSDHGSVLLLDKSLIVLLVGPRPRDFDLLCSAPGDDDIVHERAVVVEVRAHNEPGEQALRPSHGLDHEPAFARHQWQTFGPARRHIHHRQRLDERSSHGCSPVRHHVDFAEPRRWIVPIVERADRYFAPDRRVEANAATPAAAGRHLGVDQQPVDRRCADTQQERKISLAELEPAVPLQRRQQRRDRHLEPLAANPIGRFPQRHQRILDGRAVGRLSPAWCVRRCSRRKRFATCELPDRVLAMPTGHRAQFVENQPLLRPTC